jgi:hypothetical protein
MIGSKNISSILYINLLIFGTLIVLLLYCVTGCIKGSTNETADSAIKIAGSAYPDDNYVEEAVEEAIKDYTTLDIDISARSPDPDDHPVESRVKNSAE